MRPVVLVELRHEAARLPEYIQDGDVCADLYACEATTVPPGGRRLVKTGVVMGFPRGYCGRIRSRSGLSLNHGIEAGAGTIDEKYTDPIGVLLYNHGEAPYQVLAGDRVAQIKIERYERASFLRVDDVASAGRSAGFGSSGR